MTSSSESAGGNQRSGKDAHAIRLLSAVYLVEFSLVVILVGIYKAPAYGLEALTTKAGITTVVGLAGLAWSLWLLSTRIKRSGSAAKRALAFALGANLLSATLVLAAAEASLRLIASDRDGTVVIGSTVLEPTWDSLIQQSRDVIANVAPWDSWDSSYFVFDAELGWTVGSNRQTGDGLYFSSVEGIRSPGPNTRMADDPRPYRVAIVGDSNAFSFEVSFEESWGHYLQQLLGNEVQVLNFGVDAYGLDQICLRYERDVRPWAVDVVVVGFVGHDLRRTLAVYPFVSFGWPGYLVKPRFTIEDRELRVVNLPLPEPDSVLGASSVHDLPFVEYDLGYGTVDWSWRAAGLPLMVRLFTTRFPRWPSVDPRFTRETTRQLNVQILRRLVGAIEEDGSKPVVVLLSETRDLLDELAREVLAAADVPFVAVEDFVKQVPADLRLVASGNHYTGLANQAIARCTAPAVLEALAGSGGRNE